MCHPSGSLCLTNQRCAQAGDIERSGVVSGAIPETARLGTAQPGSPVIDHPTMGRGCVRVRRAATARAYVRGVAGLLPFQADASEKTLIAQHAPELSTD